MNLFDGGYPMPDDTQERPYKAQRLEYGVTYLTDADQKIVGGGRYAVFCDGLIVTTPKASGPNLGMAHA
jgi:hypothetical protein